MTFFLFGKLAAQKRRFFKKASLLSFWARPRIGSEYWPPLFAAASWEAFWKSIDTPHLLLKLGGNLELPPNYAPASHLLSTSYKIEKCCVKRCGVS